MGRSRQTAPKSIVDAWDQSLFKQAVKKVKSKQDELKTSAGEAMAKVQTSPLLPVASNVKLLGPLAGVFMALLLTTGWQVAASGWQWPALPQVQVTLPSLASVGALVPALPEIKMPDLKSPALEAYHNLGLKGESLVGAAALTGENVAVTFKSSVASFKTALMELSRNFQATAQAIWSYLQEFVLTFKSFFNQTLTKVYANFLSGVGFMSTQVEMALDRWFAPVEETASSSLNKMAAVPSAAAETWQIFKAKLAAWWGSVVTNWREFLAGWGGKSSVTNATPANTNSDIKEIKQDVKSILQLLSNRTASEREGLIVVPGSGTAAGDAEIKSKVSNMFSDPVKVELDETKRAGVITPVFSDTTDENYIFLLAPIKQ